MTAITLVIEPYGAPPSLTWVCEQRGVIDRRFMLQPRDSGAESTWVADARHLAARQDITPNTIALVTWAWPDVDTDAHREDTALLAELTEALQLPGLLVDEGGARAYAERCHGVGATLADQVHLGVGVRAAGVCLDGRWRMRAHGMPWSADGLIVRPRGATHGGRGWLRDYTWPESLTAATALFGLVGGAGGASLDPAVELRPWIEAVVARRALAMGLLTEVGQAVGLALGGLINIYDVPNIVLHLPSEALRVPLIAEATKTVKRHSFETLRAGLRWHAPTLGADAVALGASAIGRDPRCSSRAPQKG